MRVRVGRTVQRGFQCQFHYAAKKKFKHIFLIRHAESVFNARCHQFPDDQIYGNQAQDEFHYDTNLIDSGLTFDGLQQLKQLSIRGEQQILNALDREKITNQRIAIFASPLKRTLHTTTALISHDEIIEKSPVHVLPQLSEILSKICDFSQCIDEKIQNYPHFDFSHFQVWKEVNKLSDDKFGDWQDPFVKEQYLSKIDKKQRNGRRYMKLLKHIFPNKLEDERKCFHRSCQGFELAEKIAHNNDYTVGIFVAHNRVLKYIEEYYTERPVKDYENLEIRHFAI